MRKRKQSTAMAAPAIVDRRFIGDVENLAVAAANTANSLGERGFHDLARPLVVALERLGRIRR